MISVWVTFKGLNCSYEQGLNHRRRYLTVQKDTCLLQLKRQILEAFDMCTSYPMSDLDGFTLCIGYSSDENDADQVF